MKIKDTKIKCNIKAKELSLEDMKKMTGGDGGWCCGRPPRRRRRRNGNG